MARSDHERHKRRGGSRAARRTSSHDAQELLTRHGWTIVAHPLFLEQEGRLAAAAATEQRDRKAGKDWPNTKLLAHLVDLAFDAIPREPGLKMFRQGDTLGPKRKHWFRAKTGNGRFRFFFRYHSTAKLIVLAWINDSESLRTYGGPTDAFRVFGKLLDAGDPPDSCDDLLHAAKSSASVDQLKGLAASLPALIGGNASTEARPLPNHKR